MLITLVLLLVGLALLTLGAEFLVRGASRLASTFGISPLVIGLTVVAYGTSAPEMAVSVKAAILGQADIALGNVVGSNIFNVLFILGACALILPLAVAQQMVWIDVPIMIGVSVLAYLMSLDGSIGRIDGAVLVAMLVGYTVFVIVRGRRESRAVEAEYEKEFGKPAREGGGVLINAVLVLVGLGLLVWGANLLVTAAVSIAKAALPEDSPRELIIGLTIVAAGTSLPEVATSIIASIRGERDIAVGNVIGSNIFNLMGVLGVSAVITPVGVPGNALVFDMPFMVAVAAACLPIFFSGHVINRWEGALFFAYYLAYTGYLLLHALDHVAFPVYAQVMLLFVAPLTAVTLAVVLAREVVLRRARKPANL